MQTEASDPLILVEGDVRLEMGRESSLCHVALVVCELDESLSDSFPHAVLLWVSLNCSFLDLGVTLVLLLSVASSAPGFWNPLQLVPWPSRSLLLGKVHLTWLLVGPLSCLGHICSIGNTNASFASTNYGGADHFNAAASDFSRQGPTTSFCACLSFRGHSLSYSSFMNCECLKPVFQTCET